MNPSGEKKSRATARSPPQKESRATARSPPQKESRATARSPPQKESRATARLSVDVRRTTASDSRSRIRNWKPLEAHVLPSSRLANEAVGSAIRFIQGSASPPLPHGR